MTDPCPSCGKSHVPLPKFLQGSTLLVPLGLPGFFSVKQCGSKKRLPPVRLGPILSAREAKHQLELRQLRPTCSHCGNSAYVQESLDYVYCATCACALTTNCVKWHKS